jgi:hypothetical protein
MSSSSSTAGGNMYSRDSTPATDISPPGSDDFVLPPPSEETLRRRAQSDRASTEIGNRMLKGWAMLAEECPNDNCWAIPLVRFPRARPGAEPDPRKVCHQALLLLKFYMIYQIAGVRCMRYRIREQRKRTIDCPTSYTIPDNNCSPTPS